jgi:hypothetical protein
MEKRALRLPGFPMLIILVAWITVVVWTCVKSAQLPEDQGGPRLAIASIVGVVVFILIASGFVVLNPNERGSSSSSGATWAPSRSPATTGRSR